MPPSASKADVAAAVAGGLAGDDPFFWEGEREYLEAKAADTRGGSKPTAPPPGPEDEPDFWFDEETMR